MSGHQQYDFDQSYYIVGDEQRLHFQQLFLVLEKMGYEWAKGVVHIPFGFILQNGKKISTRKGKVILLEEVIQEAIALAQRNIEEKTRSSVTRKKPREWSVQGQSFFTI